MYEVVPLEDSIPHTSGEGCWCDPQWDDDDDRCEPTLMHNSADGREDYETGKRLPH